MNNLSRAALCALLALAPAHAQDAAVVVHKGVNVWPWLYRARSVDDQHEQYPTENTFPYSALYTPERLARLKAMGFDFIRIQTETTPFLTTPAGERPRLIEQVVSALNRAKAAGLTTIICPFPREIVTQYSAEKLLSSADNRKTLGEIEVQLAAALAQEDPATTIFEIFNEPPGGYHAGDQTRWNDLQLEYVKAIRRVAPRLTLLVTGDRGGGIDGLLRLDVSAIDDPHILYSFHYYDPMVFTHQGAAWTSKKYRPFLSNIAYPPVRKDEADTLTRVHEAIDKGVPDKAEAASTWKDAEAQLRAYYETPQGPSAVQADFARVTSWAKAHHIAPSRIILGEFGTLRSGPATASIVQWDKTIRTAAERAGFSWCVFDYQPNAKPPDMSLLQLTGPNANDFDPATITEGLGLTFVPAAHP